MMRGCRMGRYASKSISVVRAGTACTRLCQQRIYGMSAAEHLGVGHEALATGRWEDARRAFEAVLADGDQPDACFGMAVAAWWQGSNEESISHGTRAYALYSQFGEVANAVQCAVWLAITYKANFANFAVANGWLGRAERLLERLDTGPLNGWVWIARAYRMADLDKAVRLSQNALAVAKAAGDIDLELVALSQLGLHRVGLGDTEAGLALIDEATAAALAGEASSLDTVVYACCDMLNACELAADLERAAQWCRVADKFVETYGCPFLYAECRIYYGSVLAAKGRWRDAERELGVGLRITHDSCPALHDRASVRLAGLRIRQGRLEEADQLIAGLGDSVDAQEEAALTSAALLLARGDAQAARTKLEVRTRQLDEHRSRLAAALDLLLDAQLEVGDIHAAAAAAQRLAEVAAASHNDALRATAAAAQGRVAGAEGRLDTAISALDAALTLWVGIDRPYEVARTRFDLARACTASFVDVALEQAQRALANFDALGASIDADRAAAFVRQHGGVVRIGHKRGSTLTAREEEVLRLLGAGLSNPEIAARLYVSRKTASHHVSHILTKLNLRNRAEAAAYAMTTALPVEAPQASRRARPDAK